MKKVLLTLLAAMLVLTGCGANHTEPTDPSTAPTKITTTPPTRPPVEVPEVEEVPVVEDSLFNPWECEDLIGKWTMQVTIASDYMNIPDFKGTTSFPVTWTFGDDGRYTVTLEQKSFEAAIIGYENALADFMIQGYYNKFVAEKKISDLNAEQIQERWEEYGLSQAQESTHGFLDNLGLGKTFAQLVRGGYYHVKDGVLHMTIGEEAETFLYTIDEEGLILSNSSRIRFYGTLGIRFPTALKPQ